MDKPLLTFDEANEYLNQVADELPPQVFTHLNGGIVLLPDVKPSPNSDGGDLFTLGTYHYEPRGMGRYIAIYYGSFERVNAGKSIEAQKKELRDVLHHELTHHLESMAGVRDLEVQDEAFLEAYKRSRRIRDERKKEPPRRAKGPTPPEK